MDFVVESMIPYKWQWDRWIVDLEGCYQSVLRSSVFESDRASVQNMSRERERERGKDRDYDDVRKILKSRMVNRHFKW